MTISHHCLLEAGIAVARGMPQATRKLAWDDLQFFLAVCRHHTASAAAQQLAVDHATVLRRVARLEQALNTKLFEHRKPHYAPTSAGEPSATSSKMSRRQF